MQIFPLTKYLCIVLLASVPHLVVADVLTGSLTFKKKAPFAALLYAKETGKSVSKAVVNQKDKMFEKKLIVVGNNADIEFKNSDSFQHNIFADDKNSMAKFDLGLMESGQVSSVTANWNKNALTRIGCKIHPKMRTYVANVDSDTFQVFELEKKILNYTVNLPVGEVHKDFVLVMPKYEPLEFTLLPGENKTLNIMRKGKAKGTLTVTRQ